METDSCHRKNSELGTGHLTPLNHISEMRSSDHEKPSQLKITSFYVRNYICIFLMNEQNKKQTKTLRQMWEVILYFFDILKI